MTSKINTSRGFRAVLTTIFACLFFTGQIIAQNHNESNPGSDSTAAHNDNKEGKVDITKVAMEHILDSHSWHFWGEHEKAVSIGLPVILKTDKGFVFFNASAFHHDVHGKNVVEVNGQRFVNFEETIYEASESPNANGQYLTFATNAKGKEEITNIQPLDFSITKNVTQLLLSSLLLIWLFVSIANAYKKHGVTSAPQGKQSFFEPLIVFVRDDIAKENIGKGYEKFTPYLLTVFFLILVNNVLGLIPVSANLTGNIAFTFTLALVTMLVTNIGANGAYWKHIFLPKPLALWPIMMPIELIGVISKPFALMIRLFANIAGGHIVVISLIGLIFLFESFYIAPVSLFFTLFIDLLECLVALLQAYIFTMLTALFIGTARADHGHEEHAHEGAATH